MYKLVLFLALSASVSVSYAETVIKDVKDEYLSSSSDGLFVKEICHEGLSFLATYIRDSVHTHGERNMLQSQVSTLSTIQVMDADGKPKRCTTSRF